MLPFVIGWYLELPIKVISTVDKSWKCEEELWGIFCKSIRHMPINI